MRTLFLSLIATTLHAAPTIEKIPVFESGQHGYAMYRIPGLVVTSKGTLLAYCEARKSGGADWGHIDLVYRRSTDGGRTWDTQRFIVEQGTGFAKNPLVPAKQKTKTDEITFNNPVMIVDGDRVHFVYCVEYMRCFYAVSADDGKTFSKPVEITKAFDAFQKNYAWKVLATGPGHGLRVSKTGRLVVPVWLSTGTGGNAHRPSCVASIYSDDHGTTWQAGDIVVNNPDLANPSETTAVELADGRVMFNIRHEGSPSTRAVSISPDGATKWSKPARVDLPEPVCMGSLERFGKQILFANPHNTGSRERRTVSIHVSDDDGQTWPHRRAIESGLSGYSDLGTHGDHVYCLYERAGGGANPGAIRSLVLATVNREWLQQKPVRIVMLGDSITKGYRPGVNDEQAFPAMVEAMLRKDKQSVEVINVGIGGETSTQGKARLKAAVLAQKPDFVTIMYGANDSYIDAGKDKDKKTPRVSEADYEANLTGIVRDLQAAGIQPILMTTNRYDAGHPVDGSGAHPNKMMDLYMKRCRDVATLLKVPLVDHQQRWIDAEKKGTDIAKWMTDHVHPNVQGHQEMATALHTALRDWLPKK